MKAWRGIRGKRTEKNMGAAKAVKAEKIGRTDRTADAEREKEAARIEKADRTAGAERAKEAARIEKADRTAGAEKAKKAAKMENSNEAGKRKKGMGTARAAVLMIAWIAFGILGLTGCSVSRDNGDKARDLEFSVTADQDIPKELSQLIAEKINQPFKLTYSDNSNLYIAVGYGAQPTGGYSISVNELYLTENSIVLDTELKGPEKGENPGTEQSFPYIVIKTEYLEQPVIFQ